MKCTIVVAAYNREEPFKRVLNCIKDADYGQYSDIQLVISIDRANNHLKMKEIADNFFWKYGNKKVIVQPQRLGLREHFIFCGDFTQEYGPVIFLEDDVFVNRDYYQSAMKLTEKYIHDDRIAGASLYSLRYNETAQRPFMPIDDGSDVFFCQLMSWAPVYFPKNWKAFREWFSLFEKNPEGENKLPHNVQKWKDSSFKKKHIQFMIEKEKYFVYPRVSCATNFCEPGEHYIKSSDVLQVSVSVGKQKFTNLVDFEKSLAVYDAFIEIKPFVLKKLCPSLREYNFETDLYGTKKVQTIQSEYVMTCKISSNPVMRFGRSMCPHEANIVHGVEGQDFFLANKICVSIKPKSLFQYFKDVLYDQKGSSVLKIVITDILWSISAVKARI